MAAVGGERLSRKGLGVSIFIFYLQTLGPGRPEVHIRITWLRVFPTRLLLE